MGGDWGKGSMYGGGDAAPISHLREMPLMSSALQAPGQPPSGQTLGQGSGQPTAEQRPAGQAPEESEEKRALQAALGQGPPSGDPARHAPGEAGRTEYSTASPWRTLAAPPPTYSEATAGAAVALDVQLREVASTSSLAWSSSDLSSATTLFPSAPPSEATLPPSPLLE